MHRRNDHRRSRDLPAFPAQWFDGLCRALPGDEFVLPPSLRELTAKADPGRAPFSFAKLGTSNGCQDHTVLPYATMPLVLRGARSLTAQAALQPPSRATPSRPPHPHSTYRDDAYVPLHEAGRAKRSAISGNGKRIIFTDRTGRRKSP